MIPFKKLLVPIDFSVHSERALSVAADLARRYEASATVLHVWQPELFSVPESYQLHDSGRLASYPQHFDGLLKKARHTLQAAGVQEVESVLVQGAPVPEILRFGQEGSFDLIVMGTHGRTGLSHAVLGSVAEQVVRRAGCAVVTIRLDGSPATPDARHNKPITA
ncbi:MAG: hypothetical protein RL701_7360 [Pseudomonadota bacterium]|jgi:nucleotide-binding universal stress UspA family protein